MPLIRQLPGGHGLRKGEDRRTGQSESEFLRQVLVPQEKAWVLSTVGEHIFVHRDVTGVTLPVDELRFLYLPERVGGIEVAEIRFNVAALAASSYVEVALFSYENGGFSRIPRTYGRADTTTTGLCQMTLSPTGKIYPATRLFLGIMAHGGTPVLQGFQSGAGSTPRVVRQRIVSGHTGTFSGFYGTNMTTLSSDSIDAPFVVYLSKEASLVL